MAFILRTAETERARNISMNYTHIDILINIHMHICLVSAVQISRTESCPTPFPRKFEGC